MLSHRNRFHGHGSVRYLFHHGRVVKSPHMMVRFVENSRRVHSRATVIISKKVHKPAVKRNRVRRRVYEVVRHLWPQLNGVYDVSVTVFSPEVLLMPHEQLQRELEQTFRQGRLLKNDE